MNHFIYDYGIRLNKVNVKYTITPRCYQRSAYSGTGYTDAVTIPLAEAPIQCWVGPNYAMDSADSFDNQTAPSHIDINAITPWYELKPKGGRFNYTFRWRPKGKFNNSIFLPRDMPTSAAAFGQLYNPYHPTFFQSTSFIGTALQNSAIAPTYQSYFNQALKNSIGLNAENIMRVPAFKFMIPGTTPASIGQPQKTLLKTPIQHLPIPTKHLS